MRSLVLFVGVFVTVLLHCVSAQDPDVSITPAKIKAIVGVDVQLHCTATMEANKQLAWTKEDEDGNVLFTIDPTTEGFEIYTTNSTTTDSSLLRIKEVTAEDEGRYFCNYGGSRTSSFLTVTYEGLAEIRGNRVITDGMDMNFTCFVDDSSSYAVTWKKNNTALPNPTLSQIEIQGSSLVIKGPTQERDHGNYTCNSVYNGTKVTAKIAVGGSWRIKAPKSVKFTEGERARFECIAIFDKGDPEPVFTWMIGNETVTNNIDVGGRIDIKHSKWETGSVLHMPNVVFADAGNYTCIGNNGVTTVEHTITLRVRDRLAALWPFIGIMSEVILLIIIIFIHEKCTQGDDVGEEDEEDDEVAEPIKEKEQISLDGEGDMRMRTSKP